MKMASYQQRIPLKGTEDSIDYFTDVLKSTKDQVGVNSAEVLLRAMVFWHHGGGFRFLNQFPTSASKRNNGRVSRIFYLQVLTTADIMEQINTELDRVRRGYALKSLLDTQNVGRAEFLLEALIFILEVFKTNRTSINSNSSCSLNANSTLSMKPPMALTTSVERRKVAEQRTKSEEPSLTFTPARYGSVGRDEGFRFPTRNWRSQLREQQLADNRKLLDSVKRKRTPERNREEYSGTPHEGKPMKWQPLHEIAMNANRKNDNDNSYIHQRNQRFDRNNNEVKSSRREYSEPPIASRLQSSFKMTSPSPPPMKQQKTTILSNVRQKMEDLERSKSPNLTLKERKMLAETMTSYLSVQNPDLRETPGFDELLTNHDRIRLGIDCDEVFPNIILGNGATLKRKEYLRKIGITHILNAAEYRGVNIGQDYFNKLGDKFQYLGIRIEDTPQTQICRHFADATEFMDDAIQKEGKVFINCVFGKSRSTTFVVVYLMLCHNWDALTALKHIRQKRPVQINAGFLLQLVDLDYKLKWEKLIK